MDKKHLESFAAGILQGSVTVNSIKFTDAAKTRGTIKVSTKMRGVLFRPVWDKDAINPRTGKKGCTIWIDARGHRFEFDFRPNSKGKTFVWTGNWALDQNGNRKVGKDGKDIWYNHVQARHPYRPTIDRTKFLQALLTAAIEVRAGRFEQYVPIDDELFFAYVEEDSKRHRIPNADIKKHLDAGDDVHIRKQDRSCYKCQNSLIIPHADENEQLTDVTPEMLEKARKNGNIIEGGSINDFSVQGSRSIHDLDTDGQAAPNMVCFCRILDPSVNFGWVDADACKEYNELLREDNKVYIDKDGNVRVAGETQVVIPRYQYGEKDVLVSQRFEEDEPMKEFARVKYDTVGEVAMGLNTFKTLHLQELGADCPYWTKMQKGEEGKPGFYEWAKTNKVAVLRPSDHTEWEICKSDRAIKYAGKQLKFKLRAGGLELVYWKKTKLEKQADFLKDVRNWIKNGADTSNTEKIGEWLERFTSEEPAKSISSEWNTVAQLFNELI